MYEHGSKAKASLKGLKEDEKYAAIYSIAYFKKNTTISLKEMKNVIDWAMSIDQFEYTTLLIRTFKNCHPYIKAQGKWNGMPEYKEYQEVYQDYMGLWHEQKYGPTFIAEIEKDVEEEKKGKK